MKSEEKILEELADLSKPAFKFTPKEFHEWRQQGPYLVCKSCELTHAVFIGVNKVLTGFDKDNKPILKKR